MDMPQTSQPIAYDLRQTYAKIVGEHLLDVAYFRKQQDYPKHFDALEHLYIIVKHKFKKPKKNSKEKKAEENYKELVDKFIKLASENKDAYFNKSQDSKQIGEIKKALAEIEMFFYKEMDKANMFGSKRDMEGLI